MRTRACGWVWVCVHLAPAKPIHAIKQQIVAHAVGVPAKTFAPFLAPFPDILGDRSQRDDGGVHMLLGVSIVSLEIGHDIGDKPALRLEVGVRRPSESHHQLGLSEGAGVDRR